MDYLSLCCIIKDEDEDYLREWVAYHALLGVERFYLYDNESQIPLRQTLQNEIEAGFVIVIDIPGKSSQLPAYAHCLHYFGSNSRWTAFIDADEYIVPKTTDNLQEFLQPYEAYAALAINWQTFGSSGHIKKPPGGLIENYILRTETAYKANRHIKSIVQPQKTLFPLSPHHFMFRPKHYCVNENFQVVDRWAKNISIEKIQLHHYFCRSKEHFERRIKRGQASAPDNKTRRKWEEFEEINGLAVIEDRTLIKLYQHLKNKLEHPRSTSVPSLSPRGLMPINKLQDTYLIDRFKLIIDEGMSDQKWFPIISIALMTASESYFGFLEFHLFLSEFCLTANLKDLAWKEAAKANHIAPQSPPVLKCLAKNLYGRNSLQEAEMVLKALLVQQPQDADALASLGRIFYETNRDQEALHCLENALQINPDDQDAQYGLSLVRKRLLSV